MYIAIDFDGTCVDHRYPDVGEDAPLAVQTMKELVADGHLLILWTMRSGRFLGDANDWFKDRGIPLFGSQKNPTQDRWTSSPKCHADVYIDDAALGAPMIHPEGFTRPCINWGAVSRKLLHVTSE